MNRITAFALAVPLAIVAVAAQSAAAAPPAEPPSAEQTDTVPTDLVTLTDDTQTIGVGLPNSWTDVETAPRDGVPSIIAAPDLEAYRSPSDAPGATLQVGPFTSDTDPSGFAIVTTCADQTVVDYDDGVLVGSQLVGTACRDDGLGEFHAIVANPANQAFTAYVLVTIAGPDDAPIVDGILDSFEVTDAATAVGSVPPSTVSGEVVTTDFVTLTDDTGTISVDVPSSWVDVDTAPIGEFPQIEATPYRQAYYDTFDVPGATYRVINFTPDTESLAHGFASPDGCAVEEVQPYDDGVLVGSHLVDSGCGSIGTSEFHVIAASPADQAFTAVVVVQITGEHERPILERILDSFNLPAGPSPTTSTLPTSSTVAAPTTTTADAAGVFPPPTGEIPADWTPLEDESNTIRISVPSTWTATRLASPSDPTVPWISATTDEALFFPPEGTPDTFGVPGVLYQAYPFDPDTAARLAASSFHNVCTVGPLQTYDDGVFVGHIQTFTACNGTASSIVRVAANPADQAFTADLLIQLTGAPDDAATLNGLLLSFNSVGDPGAATATLPGATTPTTGDVSGLQSVDEARQMVEDQFGVIITDEQGQCIVDTTPGVDPTFADGAVLLAVALTCGVNPTPGEQQ